MSLLVVKMLTVLVSTISNSWVFLLKKCEQLLQKLCALFRQKYLRIYAIFNDQSFNDTLTTSLVLNNWALNSVFSYDWGSTTDFFELCWIPPLYYMLRLNKKKNVCLGYM